MTTAQTHLASAPSAVPAVSPTGPLTITGTAVELTDVVKRYAGHVALDGVSLSMRPGELVALLGPSGCGKTTVLRSLSGLESIDAGHIAIDDHDVARVPANKRDMGMVFQSYSLFPHLTVRQNVEFGLRMRRVDARRRAFRADEALELVGLDHLVDRYAHQLSGGQQQRVALARALVTRPRVLLLDEPLSALDAKVRVQLREQIRRLQKELGITTLFVTHDQEEALAMADRVAVMSAGRVEQIGTPEELYLSPRTPFVAEFVGLSNRMPGELDGGDVLVYGSRLPVIASPDRVDRSDRSLVTSFVRPEDLALGEDGIPATVVSSSFLGSMRRTIVRLADDCLVAVQHDVSDRPVIDDAVRVQFKGRPVMVAPRS